MYEIIGCRPYVNEYKGQTYYGVSLHCIITDFMSQANAVGQGVEKFSVKQGVWDMFAHGRDLSDVIGIHVVPFYDKYQKVCMLQEVQE